MNRRVFLLGAACAVLIVVPGTPAPASTDPPGISFADGGELVLSTTTATSSAVSVCNSTTSVLDVNMRVEGFRFTVSGEDGTPTAIDAAEILIFDEMAMPIEPGDCSEVTLRLGARAADLAASEYSGTLVAVSAGGGSARREVKVASGAAPSTRLVSAVEPIDLHGPLTILRPGYFGIVLPTEESIALRYDGTSPPALSVPLVIGTLANGSDLASLEAVRVRPSRVDGIAIIDVRLRYVSTVGTFVGQLDTAMVGSDEKPVSASFKVTGAATGSLDAIVLHGSVNGGSITPREHTLVLSSEGGPTIRVPRGTTLAELAQGDTSVMLTSVADARPTDDGLLVIPVQIAGAGGDEIQNGTYVGSINTDVAGAGAAAISVKFVVADRFLWVLMALSAGLVVGLIAKLISGRMLTQVRWRRARHAFHDDYASAAEAFALSEGQIAERFTRPDQKTVESRRDEIGDAVKRYDKTTVLLNASDASYKAIDDAITEVNGDVETLGSQSESGLGPTINRLDTRIADFASYVRTKLKGSPRPDILSAALRVAGRGNKQPRPLPVGGATKLVAEASETIELLDTWEKLADRLRRFRTWHGRLEDYDVLIDPQDLPRLQRIGDRLAEVHLELNVVTDLESLEETGVAADLDDVYRMLAVFGGRYGIFVPPNWEEVDLDMISNELLAEGRVSYIVRPEYVVDLAAPIGPLAPSWLVPPRLVEFAASVGSKIAAVVLEVFVLLVAFVPTFIAARALWFDKPFGSFADYLAVFALGVAAEVLISAALNAVAIWRKQLPALKKV